MAVRMGAPERYSSEAIAAALRDTKGMVAVAARKLGCSHNTIRAYARKYASVAEAMREERQMMGDVAELALFKAIQKGEMAAIIFYLKTQCKDRGYVERVEQSGPNGGPIANKLVVEIAYADDAGQSAGYFETPALGPADDQDER